MKRFHCKTKEMNRIPADNLNVLKRLQTFKEISNKISGEQRFSILSNSVFLVRLAGWIEFRN